MSAPEWDQGMGLSWSGKWHVLWFPSDTNPHRGHGTLCGSNAILYVDIPTYVQRLVDISEGTKTAPACKKCQRSREATQ